MEVVDIGFNISSKKFSSDVGEVIDRARRAGVVEMVCTGTSLKASRDAARLCKQHEVKGSGIRLWSTVGVHPHDAKSMQPDIPAAVAKLKQVVEASEHAIAVGECGLDYDRMFSPKDQQIAAFRAQMQLARDMRLPVFLHERDAFADCFEVLSKEFLDVVEQQGVVVHCFTGTADQLDAYIGIGCHIGFTGFLCKANRGKSLREALERHVTPLDRIMVETDAPYMAPELGGAFALPSDAQKVRVNRNEPGATAHVVYALAQAVGVSFEAAAAATTANARRFFRLPPPQ